MSETDNDSLFALLKEVQLEHFYHQIKAIDVTKLEHFENVVFEDLIDPQVGMGPPAARRLLEAAKRRNTKWKKNLFNIILPSTSKQGRERDSTVINGTGVKTFVPVEQDGNGSDSSGLTCLISNKDIKLLDKIGDGSFGVVMRAQWIQPNKSIKHVAVKVLKQEVILRALEDFAKEVNSMHQLRHPNLIRLYGIVLSSPMMMVTELAEQGSLRSKLVKTLGKISLSTLVDFAVQIATGMDYLETKRLIHRDLATRNIFITETNVIKIGDFGLMRSVPFDEDYYTMSDNNKVPFPWCAIESLKYRQFSHSSDTWMYGVTLWEIFSFGQEPWAGLNGSQIIKKLEQNERLSCPVACSQRIFQVISLCWKSDPKERPTFASLINYFKNTKPIRLKAQSDFDSGSPKFANFQHKDSSLKNYLKITNGDEIEVVEGFSENYWWKGQSQRSYDIGYFPRCIAKDLRNINSNDISKPLKNSFIHAGHMDPMGKKSWGNPEFIEKMYLEHPIEPPDVLGFDVQTTGMLPMPELETRGGIKKPFNGKSKFNNNNQIDKILNLDELNESKPKEDILIDFNNEIVVKNSPVHLNGVSNDVLTKQSNQDIFEMDFNSSPIKSNEKVESTTDKITAELFNLNINEESSIFSATKFTDDIFSTKNVETQLQSLINSQNKNNKTIEQETILSASIPPQRPPPPQLTSSESFKYYSPPSEPIESVVTTTNDQQLTKNTGPYYSVCSNCDFQSEVAWDSNTMASYPPPPPVANSVSQQQLNLLPSSETNHCNPYMIEPTTCQCCAEYFPRCTATSGNPYNTHCYGEQCTEMCNMQSTHQPAYPPPPPLPSCYPVAGPISHSSIEQPNAVKSTYQSKKCIDFIEELEANFSRLGKMKLDETNGSTMTRNGATNSSFPMINPPPKTYRTRRQAPPPPANQLKKDK